MQPSVAAVVVTFNRRDKLGTSIEAIRAQSYPVDSIYVIDNASTDGTDAVLSQLESDGDVHIVRLSKNIGGAGGFSVGMERAHAGGHDFVWVMDDDCYPTPECLEKLVDGYRTAKRLLPHDVPWVCSLVTVPDGGLCNMNNPVTHWDWPRLMVQGHNLALVTEATFVSLLVPAHLITELGLPLSEYFIWFDDKEFTLRLSTSRGPGVMVTDSVAVHDIGVNRGVNYGDVARDNLWKFRRGTRNQASFRLREQGLWAYLTYWRRVTQGMRRGGVGKRGNLVLRGEMVRALVFSPPVRYPGDPAIPGLSTMQVSSPARPPTPPES